VLPRLNGVPAAALRGRGVANVIEEPIRDERVKPR